MILSQQYNYEKNINKTNAGFTLIELLVVIAIIGVLSSVVLTSMNSARKKARDAKRLSDMEQVKIALEMKYDDNNQYPTSDLDGCGGWDVGNKTYQFLTAKLGNYMKNPPNDMIATDNCSGYRYYRYSAGSYGCDISKGAFYVLGVTDMETSSRPYPNSPGWSCPSRDWQNEMDWVTGGFE
jgi:prepilin-type N-terminal cleavage/methylation domain-containing protein